jgi:hypothetical protein
VPLDDIEPGVLRFVDEYIESFVAWDAIAYFHENPDVERKAAGVALDIGRRPEQVVPVLEVLRDKGVLADDSESGDEPSFRYSAPESFREATEAFLAATRDRTNRLAIVGKVLQKESRRR